MKAAPITQHSLSGSVHAAAEMSLPLQATRSEAQALRPDVASIHARHAEFVWLTLQRLGVAEPDVEDLLQEVFFVVHRRLDSFDGSSRMTTWLFGICVRVVASYRRRAFRRRERSVDQVPEQATAETESPESAMLAHEARERLRAVLDLMDLEKRAIFVMFEIDELSCEAIAEMLSVPTGTVYSRLHAARRAFQRALERLRGREAMLGIPSPRGRL